MKIKISILMGLIISNILLGGTSSVRAAVQDEVNGSSDGKVGTSHGFIKLLPGDEDSEVTEPIEPTFPPGNLNNKGNLTLDYIAPLLFDTHKLEGKEKTYTSVVENSNIQVTDKRGDEAGWNVQVSQTLFKDVTDNKKILKGTKLVLPNGKLKTSGTNVSLAPIMNTIEVNEMPNVLINAAKGSGAGTWADILDKNEIKLTIPAGNKIGEFVSTVTWSLMDAPK